MTMVVKSKKAKSDLLSIWAFIAEDSPAAADRLLDTIGQKCNLLGENSQLGQSRFDIAPEMRYFPVKNYLILYKEQPVGIEIVRVLHGSRDLNTIFHSEN